ncbi:hypothetical protein KP509_34G000300 [Ceratopteris richardii]|uniref:Uncharacterized protein n=1 Tax=Ceratopteris richardii TaxID=49495 RepID=A0A8T2QHU4_CERRI|nr:hypothetical protein KP509_34G000300 [Ceratopteris richardii]
MVVVLFWLLNLLQIVLVTAADFATFDILPSISDVRKLQVGQELIAEKLPLQGGQCVYVLDGLELPKSYEVKISYPASIPASFTIKLLRSSPLQAVHGGRRLLNTEKLMFRADESKDAELYDGVLLARVMVAVEPAGVIALPHTKNHEFAIFNILCEEVKFGIPLQAWWIAFLGVIAVGISAIAPMILPQQLSPTGEPRLNCSNKSSD